MDFDEYVKAFNEQHVAANKRLDDHPLLAVLEAFTLRLTHHFAYGRVVLPTGHEGTTLSLIVSKLTNELYAFRGSVRIGSLWGAWHHVRAAIEIDASLRYLYADPARKEKRLKQYVVYPLLSRWVLQQELELARKEGAISQSDFDERSAGNEKLMALITPAMVAEWCKLYGENEEKLRKRKHWHSRGITDLVRAHQGPDQPNADIEMYEQMCHATHVSPLGHLISNPSKHRMVGFEPKQLNHATILMFRSSVRSAERINDVLSSTLTEVLRDAVTSWQAPMKQFTESVQSSLTAE